jgi:hypothetical protein
VGVALITFDVERRGYRLPLSHMGEGEWPAQFSAHPMWASVSYGVAPTPWRAVQIAGRAVTSRESGTSGVVLQEPCE